MVQATSVQARFPVTPLTCNRPVTLACYQGGEEITTISGADGKAIEEAVAKLAES